MKLVAAVCLLLTLVGCVAPPRHAEFSIPPFDSSHCDAPDGRRWVLHQSRPRDGAERWMMFTPDPSAPKQWKESLSFAVTARDVSQQALEKSFRILQRDDPQFIYAITGSPDDFVVSYHSPAWNERGIQRVVRSGALFSTVYYQERLGPLGLKQFEFWKDVIARLPNQALQPTRMLVTFRADARPAPSTRVADL